MLVRRQVDVCVAIPGLKDFAGFSKIRVQAGYKSSAGIPASLTSHHCSVASGDRKQHDIVWPAAAIPRKSTSLLSTYKPTSSASKTARPTSGNEHRAVIRCLVMPYALRGRAG
jgi:hypothetical protein